MISVIKFSDAVLVAIIVSVAPTIASLAAWYKIRSVHKELNSRLTEWKAETKAANVEAVIAAYERGKKDQIKSDTEKHTGKS
jgi:hypothetical protein